MSSSFRLWRRVQRWQDSICSQSGSTFEQNLSEHAWHDADSCNTLSPCWTISHIWTSGPDLQFMKTLACSMNFLPTNCLRIGRGQQWHRKSPFSNGFWGTTEESPKIFGVSALFDRGGCWDADPRKVLTNLAKGEFIFSPIHPATKELASRDNFQSLFSLHSIITSLHFFPFFSIRKVTNEAILVHPLTVSSGLII